MKWTRQISATILYEEFKTILLDSFTLLQGNRVVAELVGKTMTIDATYLYNYDIA